MSLPRKTIKPATEVTAAGTPRKFELDGRPVTFVPLTIRKRHVRTVLVPPPDGAVAPVASAFDLSLIRTLGRAFYWQRQLDEGQFRNAGELARHYRLETAWVCEVMRLTRLAPDILAAIVKGQQPRHLNLQAVRREVPVEWDAQRRLLGFVA